MQSLSDQVKEVLDTIRARGIEALHLYSQQWDGYTGPFPVSSEEWKSASALEQKDIRILHAIMDRLRAYHQRQIPSEDRYLEGESIFGLIHRPISRIGIYIPGGKPLPSTLMMTGIPARLAGVEEIAVCTPPDSNGRIHPMILYLADQMGISEVYKLGGIQAIGAMAYGVGMKAVDKIFGPGNRYVNEAKRQVYGVVGIDSLAGPSEICVVADHTARADWIREDLLSQREHGQDSKAWLLTDCPELSQTIAQEADIEVCLLPDLDACIDKANSIAPEHLQIVTQDAHHRVDQVKNAGAIYLGHFTPVPAADYFLGSNHVLPTGGCARFSSMLRVTDFLKFSALAQLSERDFFENRELGIRMAEIEGLTHHRQSLEIRKEGE